MNSRKQPQLSDSECYFRGTPTAPDVRKLCEKWSDPKTAGLISYEDVEEVLGEKRTSFRFKTVTFAWRRQVEQEKDIVIACVHGRGYEYAPPPTVLDLTVGKIKASIRASKRSLKLNRLIDRTKLSKEDVRRADHAQRLGAAVVGQAHIASKCGPDLLQIEE